MATFDYGYGMAERFARETAQHQMTVLHDDGLYRHLRFQRCWWQPPLAQQQASSFYWFDLVTVPGVLIFKGDGQSFVFSRVKDMFEFFRGPVGRINPDYWSEKLTSTREEGVKVYDECLFKAQVIEAFVEAARSRGYRTAAGKVIPGGVPRGTGKALREQVLDDDEGFLCDEGEARRRLEEFEHGAIHRASCRCGARQDFGDGFDATRWRSNHITTKNAHQRHYSTVERMSGFRFYDTWEWQLRDYHWWFLWACHAIVWGIAQYDAARGGTS